MYVNPFWFGVICTLVVEVITIVVAAIVVQSGGGKRE